MEGGFRAPEGHGNHSRGNAAFTLEEPLSQAPCTGVYNKQRNGAGIRHVWEYSVAL